jgi:Uncharacterised nucleotidyltransferase
MQTSDSAGQVVATVLAGAWRKSPSRLEMIGSATTIASLLIPSGAGALGWWRVRQFHNGYSPDFLPLRETYLQYAISAEEHERKLVRVFRALRSSDVEPILIKGWAIARAYPEAGLRPSGDIDLYVSAEQQAKAKAVLNGMKCQGCWVDLDHGEITRFNDSSFSELYDRSELLNLNGTEIRVMGAEDHLRIVCLHLLKHGSWRPLWLCDVAAALEARLPSFDWDRCFGRDKRRADWIACTIGLANRLLGANLEGVPGKNRANSLPSWLVSSVLKQWNSPDAPNLSSLAAQLGAGWRKFDVVTSVRQRWPNPVQATVDADGGFDNAARLPFQLGNCVARTFKLYRQLRSSRP